MDNFIIRKLEHGDFYKGYIDVLSQLSEISKNLMTENKFNIFIDELSSNIHIFIIYDMNKNKVVGTGTIIIESKIIHNFGKVGHIEDIVVDSDYRGVGLGKIIIKYLLDYAKSNNCYKVILMASDENIEFYKKLGLKKKDNSMALYF
jgi:glucosamine-phosphate N-acetyltransferase